MNQETWTAVDCYFADLFVPSDPALDAALEASVTAGLPPINVSPNQGKLLLFWHGRPGPSCQEKLSLSARSLVAITEKKSFPAGIFFAC